MQEGLARALKHRAQLRQGALQEQALRRAGRSVGLDEQGKGLPLWPYKGRVSIKWQGGVAWL